MSIFVYQPPSIRDINEESAENSEEAKIQGNPLGFEGYRYPLEIGDGVYKHVLVLRIYRQNNTAFSDAGYIAGNSYDFSKKAGASKQGALDTAAGASVAGGAGTISGLIGAAKQVLLNSARYGSKVSGRAAARGAAIAGVAGAVGGLITGGMLDLDTRRTTEKKAAAQINLYMPDTLIVTDRQDFDAVSFTEALGAAGTARGIMGSTTEASARLAESSGIFGKGVVDAALYSAGYAMNPLLEILYKGTKNREFVFQFKFAPKNAKEADEILGIIRTLRFHAAPEYDVSMPNSRYFIPPSEFGIEFFIGSDPNTSIPRIAQCVLTNIDTNYAPSGQYSAYVDGMPTEISLQLTFTETAILTKEDVKIGF